MKPYEKAAKCLPECLRSIFLQGHGLPSQVWRGIRVASRRCAGSVNIYINSAWGWPDGSVLGR